MNEAILSYIDREKGGSQETYDENRPQTQVFSHGKVFTYEKLDTGAITKVKKSGTKSKRPEIID